MLLKPDQIRSPRLFGFFRPKQNHLQVAHDGYGLTPAIATLNDVEVQVFGHAIWQDRINNQSVAKQLCQENDYKNFISQLDGQFLILRHDKKQNRFELANDRFTSFPVYWAETPEGLVFSLLYRDLFKHLQSEPGFGLKPFALMEVVWFQRLLGTGNLDKLSQCLMPGSIITMNEGQVKLDRYWRPDFTKRLGRSDQIAGREFAHLLENSLARKTSDRDPKRYGHFLSGGHDSRLVLAGFKEKPSCFTVSFYDNYEVHCARRAAHAAGAPHHFLRLPEDYLIIYQDVLADLCSGLYATENALFAGFEPQIQAEADVVFHGHGFDYLFQGMYVPAEIVHWFGRPTFFRKLRHIDGDLAEYYLANLPFGLGRTDILNFVLPEMQKDVRDYLLASVNEVLNDAQGCANDLDRWEYMITHNPCRHYSHPNIISKWTCAEQRTASFDNALYDFYLSLPVEQRISANAMRAALKILSPRLAALPTGNYAMPAAASPLTKTGWLVGRKILRHVTGNQRLRAPHPEDRTWPDRDQFIRQQPRYRALIERALYAPILEEAMPYIDWPKLREAAHQWFNQETGGAKLMGSLLSLERFLSRNHL